MFHGATEVLEENSVISISTKSKKATSISSINNNNNNLYCSGDRYDQKEVINFSGVCAFGLYSAINYLQTVFSLKCTVLYFIK